LVHFLSVAFHIPPAFSQSACVVIFERSPDGLAAGDEVDPLPEPLVPDVLDPDVLPDPLVPEVLPDVLPLLPEPLVLDWAAAIAGANAITATTRAMTSFFILTSCKKSIIPRGDNGGRR
jgi:hypothetical protein